MKRRLLSCLAALAVAACASSQPIIVPTTFSAPGGYGQIKPQPAQADACRLDLASVQDVRSDTRFMGELSNRVVRLEDSVAWVRSGFATLKEDGRLRFVDSGDTGPRLSLSVELLKAQVKSVNMAKTASVVVRVTYARGEESKAERVFRGEINDVNWAGGEGEAHDVLNRALSEIIYAAHADIISRCASQA